MWANTALDLMGSLQHSPRHPESQPRIESSNFSGYGLALSTI